MPKLTPTRKWLTLVITCLGFFMVLLDASIVTVALPTIQNDLNANLNDLQWVVDAYTLPFAALLLTAGTLSDRFGRKQLFLWGLVIFTLGSALCGFAPSLGWLIAGRVVQGIGGAALSPGSLAVLAAAFTEPRERTVSLGIWSGVSGVALAAGPLIGGTLISAINWQAIFFVNLPLGVLGLLFGLAVLVESRNPAADRLDLPGQLLAIGGLVALTYALIEGNTQGWTSPLILGLFLGAAVLLLGFLLVESRSAEPLLPLTFFRTAIFSVANLAALTVGFALLGTVFFIAQYFQGVQGFTAFGSGLHSLPNTAGIFLAAPLAGALAARFGPRLPVTVGAVLAGIALLLLTQVGPATDYGRLWWNLGMFGVGVGLMLSPLTSAVLGAVPPARTGLASSVINTSRQIGGVIGVALLGALVQNQYASNITARLTAAGVPAATSTTIGTTVASAGAAAASALRAAHLPIPAPVVRDIVYRSFTDALHPAFLVSGILLLVTAALCAVFLGRSRAVPASTAEADALAQDVLSVGMEIG
jgi:EmrB/QacA subfamily drug resistance transporter